jgi:hypothetical protein
LACSPAHQDFSIANAIKDLFAGSSLLRKTVVNLRQSAIVCCLID